MPEHMVSNTILAADNVALRDRIDELKRELVKYGHHINNCDFLSGNCTCGFDEVLNG
jgi:hypothetical protein